MPVLEQFGQMLQQMQPPQQLPDPEAQAVLQASMAETQRRAQKDQMDMQFNMQKLGAEIGIKREQQQIDVAMNAENNLTQERMKAADLTVDEARLQREQGETAMKLNESVQRNLGG